MPRRYKVLSDLQRDAALILLRFMRRPDVARVLEVGETTVWRITQDPLATARLGDHHANAAPTSEEVASAVEGAEAMVMDTPNAVKVAIVALNRAVIALANGDHEAAQSHVKAGTAVGEMAEMVKLLKQRDGLA